MSREELLVAVAAAAKALADAVQAVLDSRTDRCRRSCAGFYVDDGTYEVEACGACAHLNGYTDHISDEYIRILPTAQQAQLELMIEDGVAVEA